MYALWLGTATSQRGCAGVARPADIRTEQLGPAHTSAGGAAACSQAWERLPEESRGGSQARRGGRWRGGPSKNTTHFNMLLYLFFQTIYLMCIIRKTLKVRKQTNMVEGQCSTYLRLTRALSGLWVSIAKTYRDETKQKWIFRPDHSGLTQQ